MLAGHFAPNGSTKSARSSHNVCLNDEQTQRIGNPSDQQRCSLCSNFLTHEGSEHLITQAVTFPITTMSLCMLQQCSATVRIKECKQKNAMLRMNSANTHARACYTSASMA